MMKIRMDLIPCMLIGGLLLWLVGFCGDKYEDMLDKRYMNQKIEAGEIGGKPNQSTPIANSISDMKKSDTFYILTEDGGFRNYSLYYKNKNFYGLKLPSGEVVLVRMNISNLETGKYSKTPVGKIVSYDVPQRLQDALAEERHMELTDTSFYVDMLGKRYSIPNHNDIEFYSNMLSLLAFLIGTIGSHILGVKLGLLPPIFPKRGNNGGNNIYISH